MVAVSVTRSYHARILCARCQKNALPTQIEGANCCRPRESLADNDSWHFQNSGKAKDWKVTDITGRYPSARTRPGGSAL